MIPTAVNPHQARCATCDSGRNAELAQPVPRSNERGRTSGGVAIGPTAGRRYGHRVYRHRQDRGMPLTAASLLTLDGNRPTGQSEGPWMQLGATPQRTRLEETRRAG